MTGETKKGNVPSRNQKVISREQKGIAARKNRVIPKEPKANDKEQETISEGRIEVSKEKNAFSKDQKVAHKKQKAIRKKNTPPKHVVVFQDEEGHVLKTTFVPHGESAVPPQMPERIGEEEHFYNLFDGWDQDYSHIEENLVLKPLYRKEPRKYLVMYFHENGSILGMESVPYGSPASQPYHPVKDSDDQYDYPFIGWTCSLDSITADTNARAVFGKVRKVFTVHFYHEDGTLLKTEKVHYDESAHPPLDVGKEADAVYHYRFAGWTYPTEHIRESLNIHAIFEYIYNEYKVTFYEEEEVRETQTLHYGDAIVYPKLSKKGYDLSWNRQVTNVQADEEIHASWTFSNPVNKVFETDEGCFQIINPSIHAGKVSCLKFRGSGRKREQLPKSVRLGDYYYEVSEVGSYAFRECGDLEILVLPDSVKKIHDRGLAGCRRLKEVYFGNYVKNLGRAIFADDVRLKTIHIPENRLRSIGRDTLSRLPGHVTVNVKKK